MSLIERIASLLDEHAASGRVPIRIEIGWKQAEALAAELNAPRPPFDRALAARSGVDIPDDALDYPPPVRAASIYGGSSYFFGVVLTGHGNDYLKVVSEPGVAA